MEWFQIVEIAAPHVVRIQTPSSSGTGFVFHYHKELVGIATAYHVIEHAVLWHDPIKIVQDDKVDLLKMDDRSVRKEGDVAVIWQLKSNSIIDWPEEPIPLLPSDKWFKVGVEAGWLGYPWGGLERLHFFSGKISDFNKDLRSYNIDGTAISGVSGGPVLCKHPDSKVDFYIIGSISAYIANKATGETLPGLSVAQDVSKLHRLVPDP